MHPRRAGVRCRLVSVGGMEELPTRGGVALLEAGRSVSLTLAEGEHVSFAMQAQHRRTTLNVTVESGHERAGLCPRLLASKNGGIPTLQAFARPSQPTRRCRRMLRD